MNLKQANESLNPLGLRVTKQDGEYRVAFMVGTKEQREASAYYTDSIEDAEGTGIAMYNQWAGMDATIADLTHAS